MMIKKSFFAKITGIKKEDQDEPTIPLSQINSVADSSDYNQQLNPNNLTRKAGDEGAEWINENYEGQLSVDVYQTPDEIVIKSAVAGVSPDDLDISISSDMITIRGQRQSEEQVDAQDYLYQECYWGQFSRSIILPQEIKSDEAVAEFKKGILTIRLPKARQAHKIQIKIASENEY